MRVIQIEIILIIDVVSYKSNKYKNCTVSYLLFARYSMT